MVLLQVPPEATEGAACVRLGDVYSLVVDTYATQGEWAHALDLLADMQEREIPTKHFISASTLRDIYHQNGIEPPTAAGSGGGSGAAGSNVRQGAFGVHTVPGTITLVQEPSTST